MRPMSQKGRLNTLHSISVAIEKFLEIKFEHQTKYIPTGLKNAEAYYMYACIISYIEMLVCNNSLSLPWRRKVKFTHCSSVFVIHLWWEFKPIRIDYLKTGLNSTRCPITLTHNSYRIKNNCVTFR